MNTQVGDFTTWWLHSAPLTIIAALALIAGTVIGISMLTKKKKDEEGNVIPSSKGLPAVLTVVSGGLLLAMLFVPMTKADISKIDLANGETKTMENVEYRVGEKNDDPMTVACSLKDPDKKYSVVQLAVKGFKVSGDETNCEPAAAVEVKDGVKSATDSVKDGVNKIKDKIDGDSDDNNDSSDEGDSDN